VPELPLVDPVLIMTVAVVTFLVAPFVSRRTGLPGLVVVILLGAAIGPSGLGCSRTPSSTPPRLKYRCCRSRAWP
jgi:Kef-type K+ transport system membrane component KefB